MSTSFTEITPTEQQSIVEQLSSMLQNSMDSATKTMLTAAMFREHVVETMAVHGQFNGWDLDAFDRAVNDGTAPSVADRRRGKLQMEAAERRIAEMNKTRFIGETETVFEDNVVRFEIPRRYREVAVSETPAGENNTIKGSSRGNTLTTTIQSGTTPQGQEEASSSSEMILSESSKANAEFFKASTTADAPAFIQYSEQEAASDLLVEAGSSRNAAGQYSRRRPSVTVVDELDMVRVIDLDAEDAEMDAAAKKVAEKAEKAQGELAVLLSKYDHLSRLVYMFTKSGIKSMRDAVKARDMSSLHSADRILNTWLFEEPGMENTVTGEYLNKFRKDYAAMFESAFGKKLEMFWKLEFDQMPCSKMVRGHMLEGRAHMHGWMLEPQHRSAHPAGGKFDKAGLNGLRFAQWNEKATRILTGVESPERGYMTYVKDRADRPETPVKYEDCVDQMAGYFAKEGRSPAMRAKRIQNRVPMNWLDRGETNLRLWGVVGFKLKAE